MQYANLVHIIKQLLKYSWTQQDAQAKHVCLHMYIDNL